MSFIKRVAIITGFLALFLGFFVGTLCPAQYLPWKERETAMTPSVVRFRQQLCKYLASVQFQRQLSPAQLCLCSGPRHSGAGL